MRSSYACMPIWGIDDKMLAQPYSDKANGFEPGHKQTLLVLSYSAMDTSWLLIYMINKYYRSI